MPFSLARTGYRDSKPETIPPRGVSAVVVTWDRLRPATAVWGGMVAFWWGVPGVPDIEPTREGERVFVERVFDSPLIGEGSERVYARLLQLCYDEGLGG